MNRRDMGRIALLSGVIGGVVVIYLGAVGMIEAFDVRNLISEIVTLGKVMIVIPAFTLGYLAVRPRVRRGRRIEFSLKQALAIGLGVGLASGAVVALFLGFVHLMQHATGNPETVRNIFISVSPTLLSLLQFGQNLLLGSVVLVLGGAAIAALGAAFRIVPDRYRRPVSIGLITTFMIALLQKIIPPALQNLGLNTDWLYSISFLGLTVGGAIIVFVVSTGLAYAWRLKRDDVRERFRTASAPGQKVARAGMYVLVLGVFAALPPLVGSEISNTLGRVAIFALMGLGLNVVVGFAGLLDLGYVAFFAVGAYATAILTGAKIIQVLGSATNPAIHAHLSFYAALPIVIAFAAFIGLLIGAPVLRLRGDYLAIVTLGFGAIAQIFVSSDWLQKVVGGAQGLQGIPPAPIGRLSFNTPKSFYYLALVLCVFAVYVSVRLANSRIGRAWSAMREDEQVAEAMGISTVKYKLLAFAIGAMIGCIGGALTAVQVGSLSPADFTIDISITVLAVIILGGMGSIPGVLVGALFLIGIPDVLDEFEAFKPLMYGAVLVAIMLLRPQGLIPNVRRSRELQVEEVDQDVWMRPAGGPSADPGIQVGTGQEVS